MRLPDFYIIGAMKSATSSLHEQLARQPGFFMSEPKEIYFFSDDPVWANGMEWYGEHFKEAAADDLVGESSTHYTKLPTYPETVARIQEHTPDAKFIYVMRHPIDRLVSQYIHHWTENEVSVDIDTAVDKHEILIAYSQYTRQLEPYFDAFGADKVLPVFFDRIRAYPQEELERVCQFLGYTGEPKFVEDLGRQNVSAERLRRSPLRDLLVYAPGVSWVRSNLVPQSIRDRVKGAWQMQKRPELSESKREELKLIFDEDLKRLGSWLGVELNCDNFKEVTARQSYDWGTEVTARKQVA